MRDCLRSLVAILPESTGEILIVADGSPDGFQDAVGPLPTAPGWTARWLAVPAGGPAKARNRALPEARGELVLFLNDDVRCEPGLLRAHDAAHRRQPGHAVMGNTRWAPEVVTSEFMHLVAHHDSFYYLIADPTDAGWEYFHTMNLSLDRRWIEAGHRFDEAFPDPAFEDTELGYRLAKQHGLRIAFCAEAVLYHVHGFTAEQYVEKSFMRGRSARRFCALYPELTDRIIREYQWSAAHGARLRTKVRALLGRTDPVEHWNADIAVAFLKGYEAGVENSTGG